MRWFGGNKGKDVKCLKLPEGIVSITIHISTRTKSHTYVYLIYMYIHTNYVYTHTYCVLLVTMQDSTESKHLFLLNQSTVDHV